MSLYFYKVNGNESGPVDAVKVLAMLENGELYTTSELRCSDESEYKPLSAFPELSTCFEGISRRICLKARNFGAGYVFFLMWFMIVILPWIIMPGRAVELLQPLYLMSVIYFLMLLVDMPAMFINSSFRIKGKEYYFILLPIPYMNLLAGPLLFNAMLDKVKASLSYARFVSCRVAIILFWLCVGVYETVIFIPWFGMWSNIFMLAVFIAMFSSLGYIFLVIQKVTCTESRRLMELNGFDYEKEKNAWKKWFKFKWKSPRDPLSESALWKEYTKVDWKSGLRRFPAYILSVCIGLSMLWLIAQVSGKASLNHYRVRFASEKQPLVIPSDFYNMSMPEGPYAKDIISKISMRKPEGYDDAGHLCFWLPDSPYRGNISPEYMDILRNYLDINKEAVSEFRKALKCPSLGLEMSWAIDDSKKSVVMLTSMIRHELWYAMKLEWMLRCESRDAAGAEELLNALVRIRKWTEEIPSSYLSVMVVDSFYYSFFQYMLPEFSPEFLAAQSEYISKREAASMYEYRQNIFYDIAYSGRIVSEHFISCLSPMFESYGFYLNMPRLEVAGEDFYKAEGKLRDFDAKYKKRGVFTTFGLLHDDSHAVRFFKFHSAQIASFRTLRAAVAAELFRRKYGRLPEKLGELVPEFLPSVPVDPFDGKELRYRKGDITVRVYDIVKGEKGNFKDVPHDVVKNGFRVYSIGRDLDDDNGRYWTFERDRKSKKCMDEDTGDISATVLLK